ncbi:hypothetical protein IGB42_02866 [Andreprevotia sp. IGB-42]|uniref:nuclear transport factor 2 family protein n=1 Tax=Andreprevotia sp. IGB-42 TaxID=2497473 RepID=UPI00135ACFFD|nr:nuclear transport factor 2 family protein [Andreprevotia sp. IGB-42]KAF0812577.1 hypothetical protein IGB42_02866 [Andreprevotia sp. IGB-42]
MQNIGKWFFTGMGRWVLACGMIGGTLSAHAVELPAGGGQAMDLYLQAWQTDDAAQRLQLLQQSVAEGIAYRDPGKVTQGIPALSGYIAEVRNQYPGMLGHWLAAPQLQDGAYSRAWRLETPQGVKLFTGVDTVEFAGDGKLKTISGRFD